MYNMLPQKAPTVLAVMSPGEKLLYGKKNCMTSIIAPYRAEIATERYNARAGVVFCKYTLYTNTEVSPYITTCASLSLAEKPVWGEGTGTTEAIIINKNQRVRKNIYSPERLLS
jgi:hypothetical protein